MLSGDSWDEMVKNSKFSNLDDKSFSHGDFGKFKTGSIGLQDHGFTVRYRNIKIREL